MPKNPEPPEQEQPEMEYQRLNPGAGGPPSEQQRRAKRQPKVTRDPGGAGIAGGSNADLKKPRPGRGPRGAST